MGAARRFVAGTIADVAVGVSESVSVMVSELSTNALIHAVGGFEVIVDRSDHHVLVSVHDQGDGTPELQSPDASEPHGRGLRIVDALSDQWGISSTADAGKSVWFRMSLDSPGTGAPTEGTTRVPADGTSQGTVPGPSRPATPGGATGGTPASQHRPPRLRRPVQPSTAIAPLVTSVP